MSKFKDVKFMNAKDKELTLKGWKTFLKHGCQFKHFTKRLYHHLIQHCNFIAHYNRHGFYSYYFAAPERKAQFFGQFDRKKGCMSVENGVAYWITSHDYGDINNAMVDEVAPYLDDIYTESQRDIQQRDLALVQELLTKHGYSISYD